MNIKEMDLLELIQRDIDEIAEWGHCNFAETFKTLILAKEEIKTLRSKVNNVVLDDVIKQSEHLNFDCEWCEDTGVMITGMDCTCDKAPRKS